MDTKSVSILIIDGDSASRNYLMVILGKEGYKVLSASLGREGLISAWRDHPDIIILDPVLPDLPGLEVLSRLRQDRRTSSIPCVALSSRENSDDMVDFLSAGCNEYLLKSNQSVQRLLELIPRLMKVEEPSPAKRGIMVAFLSAKGGAGTSSLCANIAMCLGSEKVETRVAVIDMVLPVGSIADIVGFEDNLNLVAATLQTSDQTSTAFFKEKLPRVAGWYFHLLSGSPDPESCNQLVIDRLDGIVNAILESHDYVLVDVGRTLSRISLPFILKADVIVLVTGSNLVTSVLTKKIWNFLKGQGVNPQRLYLLQNRAIDVEGLSKTDIEQMTGLQVQSTIPYMSGNVTIANNRHEPIISKFPNDSGSFAIKEVASQIAAMGQQLHHQ
jgi:MinD-like ATPase involved in chromosome partitioning or flagellar assembly/CheY-like chemotaxis protein